MAQPRVQSAVRAGLQAEGDAAFFRRMRRFPGECFPQFAGGLHLAEFEQVTD